MNKMIDHTILKAQTSQNEVEQIINEATEYDFASVCIPPNYVKFAAEKLAQSNVKVCTVIGFPLGYAKTSVKLLETIQAVEDGAEEIDMVVNITDVTNNNWDAINDEIAKIREATQNQILKVIFETALLNDEQKIKLCQICTNNDVDFVKTSTGFSTNGATVEDIKLFKANIGPKVQIKASGGVRTFEDATLMIQNGATRIGTSNGVAIVNGQSGKGDY